MSTITKTILQALLEYNRAMYIGHVYGQCTHPLETIIRISQADQRFSWLSELARVAVHTLYAARQQYLIGDTCNACKKGRDFSKQCNLVSDEILNILEEFFPSATIVYQRELCERYQSIMQMSVVDVSLYLWKIQHGEDFIVCLRKLALESLCHPKSAAIHRALHEIEILHRDFIEAKADRQVTIKEKILGQRRLETAKAAILKEMREIGM